MHINFGMPFISAEHEPHLPALFKHYQAGRSLEALWWWQYSYFNHWGTHGGAALRALHAVVAHASLDVAEERTSL